MIPNKQEQQVIDYLILHKLPLDILLEVKDHMISQVLDIQINENLSFDEAFHKTQKLWESEFKTTKYSVFFKEEIPVIVKKIVKTRYNIILKKAFLLGLISFVLNLLLIYVADNLEVYTALFRMQNCLFVLVPLCIWGFNYKIWKYLKQSHKYEGKLLYSMYQQNIGTMVVAMSFMGQIVSKKGKYPYLFFRENNHNEIFFVLATLILPYLAQVMIIFVLINFFEHKKALAKMQNFLNISIK